jgi:kynureninase
VPTPKFRPGLAGARALDAGDDLAALRREFALPRERGRALTYLCGHSLGLMPRAARRAVDAELDRWSTLAVDGHFPDTRPPRGRPRALRAAHGGWLDYHVQFAPLLAQLVGADRDEVIAMNTLTVNLHLMLATFYRPTAQRYKILIERDAFSSDRYAVESQLRWHGLDPKTALLELGFRGGTFELDRERYAALLAEQGDSIALVLLPGVQYLTGERLDLAAYASQAQRYGCRVGFDLAHAIGNVPLAVHESGAASCTVVTAPRRISRGSRAGGGTTARGVFSWSRSSRRCRVPKVGSSATRRFSRWRRLRRRSHCSTTRA